MENLKFSRPLWEHQKDAIKRFAVSNAAALFWDVGTGKTTAAIGILRAKYASAQEVLPTLILTKTAVVWNWEKEFKNNSPEKVHITVSVLYGKGSRKLSGKERIKLLDDPEKRIFIVNHEALTIKGFPEALAKKCFRCIVVDESQSFKNHKAKRLQALLRFSDMAKFRIILTGTPVLQSLLDLWAQFRFLDSGKTFGNNFFVYRNTYFIDKNAGMPPGRYFPNFVPKPSAAKDVADKIARLAMHVEKEKCLSLPPLVKMREDVELSDDQRRLYDQMKNELVAYVKGDEATASNALVGVLRLLQILSGHLKLDSGEVVHTKGNPRLDRLGELLEEITPAHKVIVWTTFRETYKDIRALCEKMGLGFAELTGDTKDRQGEIERFQSDENCRVFIGNPKAGGVGVDGLQHAASYAIYYSRGYALEDRVQSEGRNYRGGSEKHEKITHIDLVASNTLDEDVLAALERKQNFGDVVLERLKNE